LYRILEASQTWRIYSDPESINESIAFPTQAPLRTCHVKLNFPSYEYARHEDFLFFKSFPSSTLFCYRRFGPSAAAGPSARRRENGQVPTKVGTLPFSLLRASGPTGCGGSNYDSLNVAKCLVIQLVTRMNGSTRFLPRCCFWFVVCNVASTRARISWIALFSLCLYHIA